MNDSGIQQIGPSVDKSIRDTSKVYKNEQLEDDEEFKNNFDPRIRERQHTFMLRTSYHLINIILMSLCSIFI